MIRYDRHTQALAIALAALAGFVDAVGFIGSGGFFVSFMSGNSTRLGVGLSESWQFAGTALSLITAFLIGVIASSLLRRRVAVAMRPVAVLASVASVLSLAAILHAGAAQLSAFLLVAFAMGALNLLFEEEGDVRIGLTYMTGTLVKLGHRIADALSGEGATRGWVPFLALWLSLVSGGALGAFAWSKLGSHTLGLAALFAWGMTLIWAMKSWRKAL